MRSALFLDVTMELLSRGNQVRFRAEGDSMYPTIRSGEAILVDPVSPVNLKSGDIALYRSARGVTAHRMVGHASACPAPVFIFRGDALGDDEFVEASQILGRVVSLDRNGRCVRLRGRNPRAWRAVRRYTSPIKKFIAVGWRLQGPADAC